MGETIYRVGIFKEQASTVYKNLIDYAMAKSDAFMLIVRYDFADNLEFQLMGEEIFEDKEQYLDYINKIKVMEKRHISDMEVFKEKTEIFVAKLQPYLIKQRHKPPVWPGTRVLSDYVINNDYDKDSNNDIDNKKLSINVYKVCDEIKSFLHEPDGIFKWKYPHFPEDLSFFKDGYCWFESCAHEGFAFICIKDKREIEILKGLGLKFKIQQHKYKEIKLFYEKY